MFEVLVFVYENYWRGDACPEPQQLGRKLSAVGFEADEIEQAITWLDGLILVTHGTPLGTASGPDEETDCEPAVMPACSMLLASPRADSLRVYSVLEQDHLGAESLGFISFLETSGVLQPAMREIVIERAMAAPGDPVSLDDLKVIILMVYWSFGQEPDALVLDELCDDSQDRLAH